MGLKDKVRRLARMVEREMITFELEDGTTARFYSEEFMECFIHETERGRRHYFGEEPGPPHPIIEALRKVSDEEMTRVLGEHGTLLGDLLGEDQVIRGERECPGPAGSRDLSGSVRMNLKRRIEGLEERLGFREQPLGGARLRSKKKVCAPPLL